MFFVEMNPVCSKRQRILSRIARLSIAQVVFTADALALVFHSISQTWMVLVLMADELSSMLRRLLSCYMSFSAVTWSGKKCGRS